MKNTEAAWVAGIFEGEGSFIFHNSKPKRLCVSMTDKDIIDRLEQICGGSVRAYTKRQNHHKDYWTWTISGQESLDVLESIKPYLGLRRAQRADEYISLYRTKNQYLHERNAQKQHNMSQIQKLRDEGLKHREIAERLNLHRTYVSHVLRGRYN